MNDNIVTRLRHKYGGQLPICSEAADEIERLRTEITELQTRLRDTYKERDYWEWASRGQ
jgi:archaellum component FlaC